MGASNSTRKITFSNDDPGSVIKVSEAVAQRLKGGVESSHKGDTMIVAPPPTPMRELTTTHQIRRQTEEEMQNMERFWEQKMARVMENQQRIDQALQDEYNKSEQEINGLLQSIQASCDLCHEEKKGVVDCYQQNANKSLLCSKQVQAFSICVLSHRKTILEKRG